MSISRRSGKGSSLPARRAGSAARPLLDEIRELITSARQAVAQTVNSGLTMLYWHIGQRIRQEVLREKRAEYGEEILQTLSAKLAEEFGPGYSEKSLRHMVRFAEAYTDLKIVSALRRQLS